MSEQYRQLTAADAPEYLALMRAAYAPIRALGIHFDAAETNLPLVTRHLGEHGVYGLYDSGALISSLTLRYPWGPLPGPFGLPHIGWLGAHPDFRGQNKGKRILDWVERHILREQLRAPAVSLGTAINHPWLKTMYLKRGFIPQHEEDLGKGHITLFMKKILDEESHARWLQRHYPAHSSA
ncbi:GNAT family N-acetyltransferase [Brenneria populi subsp. brevivirga]|uniref:GNAT family N-acetyltransferase n=1 Tax=Brenneria populi TaxID=1505588 RepID=UPI002E19BD95|nr:GNAT family N-acetyltransferase [Brenneria populi subsp. brevivirga]